MNLHEYQGKSILKSYGVAIQEGIVVDNTSDALKAADELHNETGTDWFVVKAQIHAGGRGKAGGVKVVKNIEEVEKASEEILGKVLVTPQTGPKGKKVQRLYIEDGCQIDKEFYFSIFSNFFSKFSIAS